MKKNINPKTKNSSRGVWGSLEYYDKRYDHISTKREKKLTMVNRLIHKITTTKDPVIRQICKTHGNVFATDAIISTLMCCTRSVYPWDIVVDVRFRSQIFVLE